MISVVIPAYNAAPWLQQALDSVRAQTLPAAEVIVVDNGSSDDSAAIAARDGVTVLHEARRGAAAARNTGLRAARGDWIALLDADDYWLPEKLERCWSLTQSFPDLALLTSDYFFDEQGVQKSSAFERAGESYRRLPKSALTSYAVRVTVAHLAAQLAAGNAWLGLNSSAVFFRRADALAAGGFDETFTRLEDMEFFARLLGRVDSLGIIEVPLVAYRWHSANSTRSRLDMAAAHIRMREKMIAMPSNYVSGAEVWARTTLPRWYRQMALAQVSARQPAAARSSLRQSWKLRPHWRTALLWVASRFVRSGSGSGHV